MLRPRRKARKQPVIFIETCSWLKPAFIIFVFIFYKFWWQSLLPFYTVSSKSGYCKKGCNCERFITTNDGFIIMSANKEVWMRVRVLKVDICILFTGSYIASLRMTISSARKWGQPVTIDDYHVIIAMNFTPTFKSSHCVECSSYEPFSKAWLTRPSRSIYASVS